MLRRIIKGSTVKGIKELAKAVKQKGYVAPDLIQSQFTKVDTKTVAKLDEFVSAPSRSFLLQDAEMKLNMLMNDTAKPTKEKLNLMQALQAKILELCGIDVSAITKVPKR